jgi:hypothetical protein
MFALGMLGLWVPGLCADEPPDVPKGLPPTFVLASMDKDGQFRVRQPVLVAVPVAREVVVEQNGQKKKVTVTSAETMVRVVERKLDGKGTQVFGTDGKQLDAKAVAKALEKETAVLLSADGNKLDPFYLRVIKEGTLILVTKPEAGPVPVPVPLPMPMPKKE